MDNTKIDFQYSLEQIRKPINTEFKSQDIILDSDNINTVVTNIENSLNTLYEKTRYLEDAISYCDAFLDLKIKEYDQDIKETLKHIENIRDINKNSAYIEYLCTFRDDLSIKKDRNDIPLTDMLYKENVLMLGMKTNKNINYSNIAKSSVFVPYYNNIEKIKEEKYRSYYIEEKIASKGIKETITITLNEPTEINYINIRPVNARIQNLRLIYLNGVEDYVKSENGVIPNAIVAQIKFDIICKTYDTTKYYMDKNKITDDV